MIEGRKKVMEWFEATQFPYWFISNGKDTGSGNYNAKSTQVADQSPSDALEQLGRALDRLNGGQFTITASATPNVPAKGHFRTEFRISALEAAQQSQPAATAQPAAPVSIAGTYTDDMVQKMIATEIEKVQHKLRLEQLEKENNELKKEVAQYEKDNPWNRIGGVLADIAPAVLPTILGKAAPVTQVAGATAPPVEQLEDEAEAEAQAKMEEIIAILSSVEPETWLDTLHKLAKAVEAKPSLLAMVKNFI